MVEKARKQNVGRISLVWSTFDCDDSVFVPENENVRESNIRLHNAINWIYAILFGISKTAAKLFAVQSLRDQE